MNTMLKRLLSIVVSLTLVLSLIPWGAANVNAATAQVSAETLYSDSFDEDMALTDAGWNANANANIQNGTLNVSHTAASGNTAIYHGFEDIAKVTVEFDFTLNYEGEDDLSHAIIRLRSSGTNLLALIVRRHQMKVNTSWVNYGETWASGTTHTMKLVADADTDTCDVYVDGNLLKDDVALTENADVVNQLVLGAQGNGSGTTGITVCYDNISVKCSHVPGEWIVDTAASCVAVGSKYQSCTVCKTELNREEIPAGEHGAKDDGDCTTAVYCDGCGTQITAAQTAHKYADEFDTSCDNADCVATRKTAKTLLLRDDFNTDKALTEAGWNNNANANIQNGTLNIAHTAASGNVQIYNSFDDASNVSVEFDVALNYEGEDDLSHAIIRLRDSGTVLLTLIVRRHQMKINTSWVNYGEAWVSGVAHKIKIVAYAESGVCDVYVDDVPIADNVALAEDCDTINQIVLGAQGNGSGTTGITASYDNLLIYSGEVACNHIAGEWVVDAVANCVTDGSRYQVCTICQAEINREVIPAGEHSAKDDGDCTTAVCCAGCGTQITAAQTAHKYADEFDTSCDNADCVATRKTAKTLLFRDDFNTDKALTEAGWNNNANANIQNGTLNIAHTAASGNVQIYNSFDDASNVSVEFDVALNYEGEDDLSHAIIRLRDSGTVLLTLIVRRHQMKINASWVNYGEAWVSGVAHKIKIVAYAESGVCDVYVDDVPIADNVALAEDCDTINQIVLGAQGNGSGTTGITASYDNLLIYSGEVACNHIAGEWVVDAVANCVTDGSRYQVCTICQAEINREVIPAGEHSAEDDGNCKTAVHCAGCGQLMIAAQAEHKYTDEYDTTCDNTNCTETRLVEKTLLLRDDFNTDMAPMDAGWNSNTNANIQNGQLNITHTAASGNTAIFHSFEDASNVTVEFDFTLNYEDDDDESHAMVRLRNSGTNLLILVVRRHQMKIGDTWFNYGETWASGTTHTMKLVVDTDTDTCVMYVDGKMFKDDISLAVDASSLNQLVLGAQNGEFATGITVSYDNLLAYSGGAECSHAWVGTDCTTPETCSVCYISKFFAIGHTYDEGIVTQEPTYTVPGIMTYTCKCGDSYTEEIPALASPVRQWNIKLKEDIGLNFYLNLTDEQIQNSTLTVSFNGTSNNVDLTKLPTSEEGYRIVSVDVAAAQMNDKVTLELTIDGEQITKEYSVRQYADYVLDETNGLDAETKQLVLAMLHYGAAAQKYFGYNDNELADDGYQTQPVATVPSNALELNVNGSVDGIRLYGASLVFDSKVAVRFYFSGDVTGIIFTVEGLETPLTPVQKDGLWYVEYGDINPQDYDNVVTLVVSDGIVNMTVGYSPMHYITRMYHKESSSTELKNLLHAMYGYYTVASDYVGEEIFAEASKKYVSILGDSISTYQGVSNSTDTNTTLSGYSAWYSETLLASANDTFWGKVIGKYGMNLLVNNSCGSSRLVEDVSTNKPAGYVRVENLAANVGELNGIKPDMIFIFMGTNDYLGKVTLGELTDDTYSSVVSEGGYITPETFTEAYIITLEKASKMYPGAEIFVFTLMPSGSNPDWDLLDSYNARIRELAEHYNNVVLVDIAAESGINTDNYNDFTYDSVHPNDAGIAAIAAVLEKAVLSTL